MWVWLFCLHAYMCTMRFPRFQSEEGIGVTNSCEVPNGCWKLDSVRAVAGALNPWNISPAPYFLLNRSTSTREALHRLARLEIWGSPSGMVARLTMILNLQSGDGSLGSLKWTESLGLQWDVTPLSLECLLLLPPAKSKDCKYNKKQRAPDEMVNWYIHYWKLHGHVSKYLKQTNHKI